MFFYEGYTCPICNKAFTPNDDVVACPHCGLPHHRGCWAQEGHCRLEHLHNTEEQWSRAKVTPNTDNASNAPGRDSVDGDLPHQICPRCHTRNPEFAEICTHCGLRLNAAGDWQSANHNHEHTYGEYQPFRNHTHSTGDVNPNEEVSGTKAEYLAAIVGSKTPYYLPRFRRMSRNGSNLSWNWAAFFFGPYWFLYRKMYGIGTLYLALQIFQTGVTAFVYNTLGINNATTYAEIFNIVENAMNNRSYMYYLMAIWVLSLIVFAINLATSALGNRLYLNHCTKQIQRARTKTPDLTAGELTSLGGTTVAMAIIGYMAQYFITQILAIFLI